MLAQVARQGPHVDVVARTRRVADDDIDRLRRRRPARENDKEEASSFGFVATLIAVSP